MSILAGMFETLLNSYCSVCLIEGFFLPFAASYNRKSEKATFFLVEQLPKKFLNCLGRATEHYNLEEQQFCLQAQENLWNFIVLNQHKF